MRTDNAPEGLRRDADIGDRLTQPLIGEIASGDTERSGRRVGGRDRAFFLAPVTHRIAAWRATQHHEPF